MTPENPISSTPAHQHTKAQLAVTRAALLQACVRLIRAGSNPDAPPPPPDSEEERLQARALSVLFLFEAAGTLANQTTGGAA